MHITCLRHPAGNVAGTAHPKKFGADAIGVVGDAAQAVSEVEYGVILVSPGEPATPEMGSVNCVRTALNRITKQSRDVDRFQYLSAYQNVEFNDFALAYAPPNLLRSAIRNCCSVSKDILAGAVAV